MPSAYNFFYQPPQSGATQHGPIRFGYFGGHSERAATPQMVQAFLEAQVPGTLHICGHGNLSASLKNLAARHPNFQFDGLLANPSDCLAWAQAVDVLVNPRLASQGINNSFPSKIFEFAMTSKAIFSTRTGGVDQVLGDEGIYVETEGFEASMRRKFSQVTAMDRSELQRRGTAIRDRVLKEQSWEEQARRIIEFLGQIVQARQNVYPSALQQSSGH